MSNTNQNVELNNCEKQSTITFFDNNELIINEEKRLGNQNCYTRVIKGKWNLKQGELKIAYTKTTSPIPNDFSESPTYIKLSNDSIKIGYYSTDNTKLYDDNSKVVYSYIEFIK